jgi:hypothetical protein
VPSITNSTRAIANLNPLQFMKFRKARAQKTRNVRAAFIGDSTTAGVETGGGTSQVMHSIPSRVASKLQARGINASAQNRFGCASSLFSFLIAMDSSVTATGGWSQSATLTVGGNAFAASTAGTLSFAFPGNTTKAVIVWRDGAAGRNFSWNADGGAATQINSSGTTSIRSDTVTLGASGSHTLNIAWVAGSVTIMGVYAYDDTGGRTQINCWNWGISGARGDQLVDNSDTSGGRMASLSALAPDLSIIKPLVNDWLQSISIDTAITNVATLVTACQVSGDVLICTPRYDNSTGGAALQQDAYVAALKVYCASAGLPLLDTRSYFGSYAIGNAAGFYSDNVHGDTLGAGYDEEAELITRALLSI